MDFEKSKFVEAIFLNSGHYKPLEGSCKVPQKSLFKLIQPFSRLTDADLFNDRQSEWVLNPYVGYLLF